MNTITIVGNYVGDHTTDSGFRSLKCLVPGSGKKPVAAPIYIIPSYAAGDSCAPGSIETNHSVLVVGRLYPGKDYKMYVVPTQPIQVVPDSTALNHVSLAGGVGFIGEQRNEDVFNFGIMCKAPSQRAIGFTKDDSLGFRIESWGDDAQRMKKWLFVGRSFAMGGALRYETWQGKAGTTNSRYKIRVKSSQYSFFGKNKPEEKKVEAEVYESPHQQAISKPNPPAVKNQVDDGIPF